MWNRITKTLVLHLFVSDLCVLKTVGNEGTSCGHILEDVHCWKGVESDESEKIFDDCLHELAIRTDSCHFDSVGFMSDHLWLPLYAE